MKVTPKADRSGIGKFENGVLFVRIAALPADGAANEELIRLLSSALRIPRAAVSIRRGARGRMKDIVIVGMDTATLALRLEKTSGES